MKCCKILHVLLLLNFIVQGHNNRKTNTRKRRIKNGSEVAEKIDLVFIIDESEGMSEKDLQTADKTTLKLLKHFSISPGTTRVGLYTVGENFKKHFQFRDHVNRECVMKNIRKLVLKTSQRNENFTENLRTGFDEIKEKHTDIEGQRRIYLYITNKAEDIKLIESELGTKLDRASEVIVLLLKKKHHESNDMLKKDLFIDRRLRSGGKIQVVNLPTETEHILNKMNVKNKQYGICKHKKDGSPVMDECNRHCTCVNQKLTNCYRLRKEFTSMTSKERRRYLKVYKTLTTKSPYKETYEPFIFMHFKYFCKGIHDYRLFLPWHRWYLSMMEDLLRQIDCSVTIPYWDWSYVSHDPWNRTNLWRSSNDGLGPNGDQSKGYCVQEGLFRESQWKTPYWEDPLNIIMKSGQKLGGKLEEQREHLAYCLRRGFHGYAPSYISVQRALLLPPSHFPDFLLYLRYNYHDRMHDSIGGTMSSDYAGSTPEFFFHHGFLDKIWFKWQSISSDHKWLYFLNKNHTKMLGSEYTQSEYIDCDNLPRCIKVKYEDFPTKKEHYKGHRQRRSSIEIDSMGRMPDEYWQSYLKEAWRKSVFDCTCNKTQEKRVDFLQAILDGPGKVQGKFTVKGLEGYPQDFT